MLTIEKRQILADANCIPTQFEWVRWHRAANAAGLGKTRFYEMLNETEGEIRTLILKSPGAQRGARLVHWGSLMRYLDKLAEEQKGVVNE